MSRQAFDDRWNLLQDLRRQGHVELSDFLGSYTIDPLVQLGLLERSEETHPYQRYGGCTPTATGSIYMGYDFLRQLIVVRAGHLKDLHACLMHEAVPAWTRDPADVASLSWVGHPVYDTSLRQCMEEGRLREEGYMMMDELWSVHRIDINQLIASRFCEYRLTDGAGIVYALQPTERGSAYLYSPPELDRMLLRPHMGAELFKACMRATEERLGATG